MKVGETELEQYKRFNAQNAEALDRANNFILVLEERIRYLQNRIWHLERPQVVGKTGEEIMREIMM